MDTKQQEIVHYAVVDKSKKKRRKDHNQEEVSSQSNVHVYPIHFSL